MGQRHRGRRRHAVACVGGRRRRRGGAAAALRRCCRATERRSGCLHCRADGRTGEKHHPTLPRTPPPALCLPHSRAFVRSQLYTPFDMLAFSGVRDVRLRDLLRAARDFRGSGREYIKQSLSTFIAGVVACDGWTVFADLPHIVSLVPVQGSVVQRLRARADELETAVDAVRTVVDGGGDALEALTRATEQVEAAVAEARSVDDMRARLVETEASVEALTEEVASLREIADLRAEEIGALRSSIGAGRATVSEAARRRAAASALAAELQRTLAMPDDVTDAAASAPELEDTAVNEGAQVTARLHDEAAGLRYSVKGLQEECDAIAADNKLVQLQNSVISALVSVAAATVVATWCTSS